MIFSMFLSQQYFKAFNFFPLQSYFLAVSGLIDDMLALSWPKICQRLEKRSNR